eukprot:JP440375.1.p3 GENE.JP440375.1~~JP440375.1.p3  ORF type:complete len:60 (+),score=3.28 JP440375.1:128-307(+)
MEHWVRDGMADIHEHHWHPTGKKANRPAVRETTFKCSGEQKKNFCKNLQECFAKSFSCP